MEVGRPPDGRRWRRAFKFAFWATLVWLLMSVDAYGSPKPTFVLAMLIWWSGLALTALWVVTAVAFLHSWWANRFRAPDGSLWSLAFASIPFLGMSGLFLVGSDLPTRVKFELSQSALAQTAESMRKDGEANTGFVGMFDVKRVEQVGTCVHLITGGPFLVDYGLAECPTPPEDTRRFRYTHLTGDWWVVADRWFE